MDKPTISIPSTHPMMPPKMKPGDHVMIRAEHKGTADGMHSFQAHSAFKVKPTAAKAKKVDPIAKLKAKQTGDEAEGMGY